MLLQDKFTTESLYNTLKDIKQGGADTCQFSYQKCAELVPLINEINELKQEKDAVILAHSYVSAEIIYGVSDYVGDSYKLSKNAMESKAKTIIFSAVRFMGETAQILNPDKNVLIPGVLDGCTLSDSINAEDVRQLRKQYPDYVFVCYINTTAEVKAECDVTVTSSNAYDIVEVIENDKIYFLPDKLMGQNIKNEMRRRNVKKDIQYFSGTCYVHEEYDLESVNAIKSEYPNVQVVSHPECSSDVCENSDYVGSTEQILSFMKESSSEEFLMLTECGLSARLQREFPNKKLVGSCTLCRYMKSNTLENIKRVLLHPIESDYVRLEEATREKALLCVNNMFHYVQKFKKS